MVCKQKNAQLFTNKIFHTNVSFVANTIYLKDINNTNRSIANVTFTTSTFHFESVLAERTISSETTSSIILKENTICLPQTLFQIYRRKAELDNSISSKLFFLAVQQGPSLTDPVLLQEET